MKAAALVVAAALAAPSGLASEIPPLPPVAEWAVDAGTRGVLVEDHRVPVVAVQLAFPAGSWGEWGRTRHLEEAFEIQRFDARGEWRRRAQRLGLDLVLETGPRASTLTVSCRKEDLGETLELVRDLLAGRDFDRAELRRWKQQRRLAWSASQKEPRFVLEQAAARRLFVPGDPRRRPYEKPEPASTDVPRLVEVRDAAIRFPGRFIGFGGDLDPDEARRAAERLLPPPLPERPAGVDPDLPDFAPPERRSGDASLPMRRLTQVYFAYGRDSLSWSDADWPAALIADHVLGGHFNSRLMTALRQEGGETYGASVSNRGGTDRSLYGIGTYTRVGNAGATEAKLRLVLETFHRNGITEDERALAADAITGRRAFARQSPRQLLATRLAERLAGLPPGFQDELARRAAAVPLEEVNAFIRRFHDPRAFTMLRLVPR